MSRPPFRADVVGSFLRPARLKAAREQLLGPQTPDQHLGPHGNAELRAIEDDCVREVVAMQERVGLQAATDGEFRRRSWWLDLIMGWEGFSADRKGHSEMSWRNAQGVTQASSRLWVTGPIRWRESATVRAFKFLKANCKTVPKVTLPAPLILHMFGGRGRRHLHPVRRHQHRLPVRPAASRLGTTLGFGARRFAADLRRADERGARRTARSYHGDVPSVPRQP